MARVARTGEETERPIDPLPPQATTGDVYDVQIPIPHHEVQMLATEVEKMKQAPREAESVEKRIQEIESTLKTEKDWDDQLAEVEAKVGGPIDKTDAYDARKAEARKLNEAQLKVYKDKKEEAARLESKSVEPKRIEAKSNDPKKG